MMGNPTLWKPSDTAILSNYLVYEILRECGLPDNIIQFVPADGPVFGDAICTHPHLSMVNFTGSGKIRLKTPKSLTYHQLRNRKITMF